MNSLHVLFTAIKARFKHANSTLIHRCTNSLIDTSDDLHLSALPNCSRSFWDSQAIVFSIINGARGDHLPEQSDDDDYATFITAAINSDTDHVQRTVYHSLFVRYHTTDIDSTLSRRCCKYFHNSDLFNYSSLRWHEIIQTACKMSVQIALS